MDKLTFLKQAYIVSHVFSDKAWMVKAFAIPSESETLPDDGVIYDIVRTKDGYYGRIGDEYILLSNDTNTPLYKFNEEIDITPDDIPNIDAPTKTTIGRYTANWILLVRPFGNKIPYINGHVSVSDIEEIIAKRLESNPSDPSKRKDDLIYVDEYETFVKSVSYINGLSVICVTTATEKNILPPPDIEKKKKELLEQYKDRLNDYTAVAELEKKLLEIDKEWLKDDPSYGKVVKGKVANIARKKMYLMFGTEAGFDASPEANPITQSLVEGWPTDPEQLVQMFNASRAGSFSRGNETQKGGVVSKVLLRSASNINVEGDDCGTQIGILLNITNENHTSLIGRYIIENKSPTLIENKDTAKKYIGKTVEVRSPMYCKQPNERICSTCAGKKLSLNPRAISMALTEISSIILNASMKAMHGKELKTTKLDPHTYIT